MPLRKQALVGFSKKFKYNFLKTFPNCKSIPWLIKKRLQGVSKLDFEDWRHILQGCQNYTYGSDFLCIVWKSIETLHKWPNCFSLLKKTNFGPLKAHLTEFTYDRNFFSPKILLILYLFLYQCPFIYYHTLLPGWCIVCTECIDRYIVL